MLLAICGMEVRALHGRSEWLEDWCYACIGSFFIQHGRGGLVRQTEDPCCSVQGN